MFDVVEIYCRGKPSNNTCYGGGCTAGVQGTAGVEAGTVSYRGL